MTYEEARRELDRVVKEEFPLVASDYIDQEIMIQASIFDCNFPGFMEWRGVGFPYRKINDLIMRLVRMQYRSTSDHAILNDIGEKNVVEFLNNYFYWVVNQSREAGKALEDNSFDLTEEELEELEEYKKTKPIPCNEPLDVDAYLHMCRIAYDAAPMCAYPGFISDLYVVAQAKFDSCGLTRNGINQKMKVGDVYPDFMRYHSEEMGFGGPYVSFKWIDDGWIMYFGGHPLSDDQIERNKNRHRFLAMRRAGYPVILNEYE